MDTQQIQTSDLPVRQGQQWQKDGEIILVLKASPIGLAYRILASPDESRVGTAGRCRLTAFSEATLYAEMPPSPETPLSRLYVVLSALLSDESRPPELRALAGPIRLLSQHIARLEGAVLALSQKQDGQDKAIADQGKILADQGKAIDEAVSMLGQLVKAGQHGAAPVEAPADASAQGAAPVDGPEPEPEEVNPAEESAQATEAAAEPQVPAVQAPPAPQPARRPVVRNGRGGSQ